LREQKKIYLELKKRRNLALKHGSLFIGTWRATPRSALHNLQLFNPGGTLASPRVEATLFHTATGPRVEAFLAAGHTARLQVRIDRRWQRMAAQQLHRILLAVAVAQSLTTVVYFKSNENRTDFLKKRLQIDLKSFI
jgi:hypothetical protein